MDFSPKKLKEAYNKANLKVFIEALFLSYRELRCVRAF
jgi:hypothetical protein